MGRHKKRGRKKVLTEKQYRKNQDIIAKKWRKEHTTALAIRLVNGKDDDIKNHLQSITDMTKTDYIKKLIRQDIASKK